MKLKLKTKWKRKYGVPVWENENGNRIHISGLLLFKGEKAPINLEKRYSFLEFVRLNKMFGGNCRRRTLMYLAELNGA